MPLSPLSRRHPNKHAKIDKTIKMPPFPQKFSQTTKIKTQYHDYVCKHNNNHKNHNDRKTSNHIKTPHGKFLNHISESSSNPIYTHVGSSLDDVTKSLNATLAHTLADGHCFLHAVALQLSETPNSMQAYKFLMKVIETESTRNKNHYRNCIDENSGRLDLMVQKYLHSKIFDHAAGDLIPQITSNALQKPIHIYSERDGGIWKTIVQPTVPRNINKSPLLVHLKDYHYSALIKEEMRPLIKFQHPDD
ncbi:OTU domain [Trinorchestia longiramus]|nr:OTU domain [Trinorchestia longiramus]